MIQLKLFLGFALDDHFEQELQLSNSYLRSLMIGKEEYLQEVSQEGQRFLGKTFAAYPSLEELNTMEVHLLSLLRKLAPHYPFEQNPPKLVTLSYGS